jgi:hypothetical protein
VTGSRSCWRLPFRGCGSADTLRRLLWLSSSDTVGARTIWIACSNGLDSRASAVRRRRSATHAGTVELERRRYRYSRSQRSELGRRFPRRATSRELEHIQPPPAALAPNADRITFRSLTAWQPPKGAVHAGAASVVRMVNAPCNCFPHVQHSTPCIRRGPNSPRSPIHRSLRHKRTL